MKRILVVARSLPFHGVGGMEAVAWDLAREFAALGHEVQILTTVTSSLKSECVIDGVCLTPVAAPSGKLSGRWWRGSKAFYQRQARDKFDAVLSVSAAGNAIAKLPRAADAPKFIFQAHGTSVSEIKSKLRVSTLKSTFSSMRNIIWFFRDISYRNYDAICAISTSVRDDLSAFPTSLLVGSTPVRHISNGVSERHFSFDVAKRSDLRSRFGVSADEKLIITFSRLHQQKGVLEAVEIFSELAKIDPKIRFAMLGAGPEEASIIARIERLRLVDKVKFVGAIERSEAPAWLSAADCMLFPTTRVEGLPMNILEALATGLPVVTSPNACEAELPCVRVSPDDRVRLVKSVLESISSEYPVERISKLPDKYKLETVAQRYIEMMGDV